ncbi:MAG: PilT protein domain protein [Phycisphaerales bacterium]|nr:PilT protein domain protein [Phycisphaerales bacterium]
MIVLDTHIWRWWVDGGGRLTEAQKQAISSAGPNGLGVIAISCWEVAKAVESGTMELAISVSEWIEAAVMFKK